MTDTLALWATRRGNGGVSAGRRRAWRRDAIFSGVERCVGPGDARRSATAGLCCI